MVIFIIYDWWNILLYLKVLIVFINKFYQAWQGCHNVQASIKTQCVYLNVDVV
jgi:hypothetical protein